MVSARARVVIGADGRNSKVAQAVRPEQYHDKPILQWSAYTYLRDLPTDGMERIIRPNRGWAAIPTNDGLTIVVVGWPAAESHAYRTDIEANYLATLELAPEFGERVRVATRAEHFRFVGVANFYRRPFGPGWALVGDAGYCVDVGVPAVSGRAHLADLRVHDGAGDAGARACRGAAVARRGVRQPGPSSTWCGPGPHHVLERQHVLDGYGARAVPNGRLRTTAKATTSAANDHRTKAGTGCGRGAPLRQRTSSAATGSRGPARRRPSARSTPRRRARRRGRAHGCRAASHTQGSAARQAQERTRRVVPRLVRVDCRDQARPSPRRRRRRQLAGRTASAWRFAGRALSSRTRRGR